MTAQANQSHPLTDEDCDCLDEILTSIAHTRELLAKCKDCGLDVASALGRSAEQQRLAENLKARFFPNRP